MSTDARRPRKAAPPLTSTGENPVPVSSHGATGRLAALAGEWRSRLSRMPLPLAVFLLCFAVYSYRPLIQSSMDNQPLRWGATLIATQGTLDFANIGIDPGRFYSFRVVPPDDPTRPVSSLRWLLRKVGIEPEPGSIRSHTPIGTALLGAPFFAAANALGMELTRENVVFMDSFAATVLTALSAAMVAWLLRGWGVTTAGFLALAFAFGTASWSTASRCLWQHTGAQFCVLGALCFLHGENKRWWRVVAGAGMLAFTVWCRPFLAPACAVILLFEFRRNWRAAMWGLGAVGVAGVLWVAFNVYSSGGALGTYVSRKVFATDLFTNYFSYLFGSLVSPNRGLVVFAPILILGIVSLPVALWRGRTHPYEAMLGVCALLGILLRGFTPGWFGGHSYGSRYMLDASPFLILLMAPLVHHLITTQRWKIAIPVVLLVFSAGIQWLGVTRDYESWNILMEMNTAGKAWEWKRSQILHCLTYGESTREPLRDPRYYTLPRDGVIDPKHRATDNRYLRYGVTYQEPWGPWIMPPRAGLVVNMVGGVPLKLKVELTSEAFEFNPTVIRYYWNGEYFAELVILRGDTEFKNIPWFKVDKRLVREGLNTLEMRVSRAYYPGAAPAALGAALGKIIILPDL